MAISFPTGLDSLTRYVDGETVFISATQNNMQLAIEALEVKVGINSSAVTTSHDYKFNNQVNFNVITILDSDANAMLKAHAYLTEQDGFVQAYVTADGSNFLRGYYGATTDPAGAGVLAQSITLLNTAIGSISFAIPSGKYFEITTSSGQAATILWQPAQKTGGFPVDQD